ncbi:hypothetical protein VNI00_015096 [Paramarasmius palmivorus]|uniref:Uncharacterized protein n=1 Tax=Paramarasmius palmivorus TaxID=297713 RepID=A0AAW0BNL5_9AGAR
MDVKPDAPTINENAVTLTLDWMAHGDGPFTVGLWADPGKTTPSTVPPPVATTPLNKEARPMIVTFTAQDLSQGAYYVSGGEEKDFSDLTSLFQAAFTFPINVKPGTGNRPTSTVVRHIPPSTARLLTTTVPTPASASSSISSSTNNSQVAATTTAGNSTVVAPMSSPSRSNDALDSLDGNTKVSLEPASSVGEDVYNQTQSSNLGGTSCGSVSSGDIPISATPTPSPEPNANSDKSSIIGGTVGGLVFVLIGILVLIYLYRRSKRQAPSGLFNKKKTLGDRDKSAEHPIDGAFSPPYQTRKEIIRYTSRAGSPVDTETIIGTVTTEKVHQFSRTDRQMEIEERIQQLQAQLIGLHNRSKVSGEEPAMEEIRQKIENLEALKEGDWALELCDEKPHEMV